MTAVIVTYKRLRAAALGLSSWRFTFLNPAEQCP